MPGSARAAATSSANDLKRESGTPPPAPSRSTPSGIPAPGHPTCSRPPRAATPAAPKHIDRAEEQRVAVGRGARDARRADGARATGLVRHHERLSEPARKPDRKRPRETIRRRTCERRIDHRDAAGRIIGLLGAQRTVRGGQQCERASHGKDVWTMHFSASSPPARAPSLARVFLTADLTAITQRGNTRRMERASLCDLGIHCGQLPRPKVTWDTARGWSKR